jgi:tetratricopeptide (TPR) repeat protein
MLSHELPNDEVRQKVRSVPASSARRVVQAAQRRLREDPGDPDALFAVAAWKEIAGDPADALDLLNRLVSQNPDYPGVWFLRARVLKDMGRERDAVECERIARIYAEADIPECVRKFPL